MSIYTDVVEKLTKATIYNMRQEHISSYEKVLKDMEDEFDILNMNIAVCKRETTNKNLCDIRDKLEAYYRNKYEDILFPLFIPFSVGKIFNDVSTREFVLCTRQFFIKKWKDNRYYCLPVSDFKRPGIIFVIPPEELDEDIKGYKNPTMSMLDFYIHLLKEIQLQRGVGHPECNIRECEYNYGERCWYEDIAHVDPENRLCDHDNKEVK